MTKKIKESQPKRLATRAAIYARYSSDMQSQYSADDQIDRIKYKLKNGQVRSIRNEGRPIDVINDWVLKDEAQSGRLAGRENYEHVLEGIRLKSFDILIVDDLSRLTRSLGNLLSLYDMLKWYEVELVSICDGISSEDPSAKTFFTVKGMVNDFSNDIHAERVIRGMEMRALQGFSCGDHPYGYDSNPTKFENAKGRPFPSHFKITINETEAQIIRRIFAMYDLGIGFQRIAKALNNDSVPSPRAEFAKPGDITKWSPRGAQHILQNDKYVGIWRWKKTKVGIHPETRLRASKDRPITDWVAHLGGKDIRDDLRIIDQELWDRVSIKFMENKKQPTDVKNKGRWVDRARILPDHPFSGLMECGLCFSNFMLVSGKKGGYYGCASSHKSGVCTNKQTITLKRIESTLFELVADKLDQPEILDYAAKKYNQALHRKLSSAPERLKQIEDEIQKTEQELTNLIQFVIGGNTSETINASIKDRENRKAKLLTEARMLQRHQTKLPTVSSEELRGRLSRISAIARDHSMEVVPAIRALFPKRVKMEPKGKTINGISLYSMKGQIVLNGVLGLNFERAAQNDSEISPKNKKGEAASALPLDFSGSAVGFSSLNSRPCVPKGPGFIVHEIGVIDGA